MFDELKQYHFITPLSVLVKKAIYRVVRTFYHVFASKVHICKKSLYPFSILQPIGRTENAKIFLVLYSSN